MFESCTNEICKSSIEIKAWLNKYTPIRQWVSEWLSLMAFFAMTQWDVITYPCHNINSIFTKLQLKLGHGLGTISHTSWCMWQLIHALISQLGDIRSWKGIYLCPEFIPYQATFNAYLPPKFHIHLPIRGRCFNIYILSFQLHEFPLGIHDHLISLQWEYPYWYDSIFIMKYLLEFYINKQI